MKNILILEDNKKILDTLSIAAKEVQDDICVYSTQTVELAYAIAFSKTIDLFLLDIILTTKYPGDISGFNFARQIRKHELYMFTPIIFITSLEDRKLYAYSEIHSYAYLEKPFSMLQLKTLIEKTLKFPSSKEIDKELYMRKDGILYQVKLKKIIYVECENHKLLIHMTDKFMEIPYYTIKKFLKEADVPYLFQCSRNTVVNRSFIDYVDIVNRYIQMKNLNVLLDIGPTFIKKISQDFTNV